MDSDGYKIRDQSKPHFITLTVVGWIDAFTRKRYKDALIESLNYCIENKGLVVFGYVIMSNHVHLLCEVCNFVPSTINVSFNGFEVANYEE